MRSLLCRFTVLLLILNSLELPGLAGLALQFAAPEAHADSPPLAEARPQRQKVIDFDDETIEGLNKRPLDSLSQISERDKRRKRPHLYRKRAGFRTETAETLRVMRYLP